MCDRLIEFTALCSRLDSYGWDTVRRVIESEYARCEKQQTLLPNRIKDITVKTNSIKQIEMEVILK